jgi:hypothetical protein
VKHLKILLETAITALGLLLVIVTLSGQTRRLAVIISCISVCFYLASQYIGDKKND